MKILYLLILILISSTTYSSQQALTDKGEIVILNDDGTWRFINDESSSSAKIKTNHTNYKKPKSSSFLLKSSNNKSAYWINPNKWSFTKNTQNQEAEYEFKLKGKDLYAMVVTEEIVISKEALADIALENARSVAPDIRVTKKEYRTVNNQPVIYMEMVGTMQSIKFTYLSYYYSDESGSTQLITYTGSNLASKYQTEIQEMLNGLTTQ